GTPAVRCPLPTGFGFTMRFQPEIDMSAPQSEKTGPDLTLGLATGAVADGKMLVGHVGEDAVLLARRGDEFFAIGATCTHYNGPLAAGLLGGDTLPRPHPHHSL